jgi:hypothetical protein
VVMSCEWFARQCDPNWAANHPSWPCLSGIEVELPFRQPFQGLLHITTALVCGASPTHASMPLPNPQSCRHGKPKIMTLCRYSA